MAPSPKSLLLLALLLACDAPAVADRRPTPAPMLAAAEGKRKADKPPRSERPGKRKQDGQSKPDGQNKRPGKRKQPGETTTTPAAPAPKSATRAPASGPAGPPLPACPPSSPLSHRSFGDGFLRTWCTGCHSSTLAADDRQGAPQDLNFDSAALYKPHARLVYERAVLAAHAAATDPKSAAPMPPAGVVPEADRRRLSEWIACGSPGT